MNQLRVTALTARHALLWLALASALAFMDFAMLALETGDLKRLAGTAFDVPWWILGMRIFYEPAALAACLVASGALIRSRCLRSLGRLQPGHWMAILMSLDGILKCAARAFALFGFDAKSGLGWGPDTAAVILWFSILQVGMLYGFAAIRLQDATRWRFLLAVCAANVFQGAIPLIPVSPSSLAFYTQVYRWFLPSWLVGLTLIALLTIIFDWPGRATRDWAHWVGVSIWIIGNLAELLRHVYFVFMMPLPFVL